MKFQQSNPSDKKINTTVKDMQEVRSIRALTMVANIAAPVSLFIGGTLLSLVGLICAIIALVKVNKIIKSDREIAVLAKTYLRSCFVGLALCVVVLLANIATLMTIYPVIMEMMESGDYSALTGAFGGDSEITETWG